MMMEEFAWCTASYSAVMSLPRICYICGSIFYFLFSILYFVLHSLQDITGIEHIQGEK